MSIQRSHTCDAVPSAPSGLARDSQWARVLGVVVAIGATVFVAAAASAADQKPPADAAAKKDVPKLERVKVMVPDVKSLSEEVSRSDVETTSALLSYQLGKVPAFDVVSSREVREMLELETSKQLSGCSGEASCLSEIADALDAELVVTGVMSQLGGRRVLQLSIINTGEASVKARSQIDIKRMSELAEVLRTELNTLCEPWGGIPSDGVKEETPNTSVGRQIAQVANRPDTSMLLVQIGVGALGIVVPLMLITPVVQALAFLYLGDEIAGRDYPNWWWPIWAGYVAYGMAIVFGLAVAGGVAYLAPNAAAASGVAAFFAGAFLFEPVVAWAAGIIGARDIEIAAYDDAPANAPGTPDTEIAPPPPPSESTAFLAPTPIEWLLGTTTSAARAPRIAPIFGSPTDALARR